MAWAGSSKPRRRRFWQWTRRSICTTPAGPTRRWATAPLKRRTAWRHESVEGRTGKRVRTGRERPVGCAASRLRSGSRTRLRSVAKRRNQPQISHIRKTPDKLTNLSQDLTSWNRLSGMNTKTHGRREEIRYSEAFKPPSRLVRELEEGGIAFDAISLKYGIKGSETVSRWVRQYGNGTRGKVIRVERPGEIDELKRLKARVRQLESALADANIDGALERAYTRLACKG